jgi:hypothetical protein
LEEGINQTFHDRFPNARQFMTVEFGGVTDFNRQQQAEFVKWLRSAVQNNEIDRTLAEEMSAYFMLYYRGRGVVPAQEVQYTGPLYEGVE